MQTSEEYVKKAEGLQDLEAKTELLRKAIEIDNHAWGNILMIKLLEQQDDPEELIPSYIENLKQALASERWMKCEITHREANKIIEETSTSSWRSFEKRARRETDKKKAAALLEQAITMNSSESPLYVKLAEVTEDTIKKTQLLEKAIEIDNHAWGNILMIKLLIERAKSDQEIEKYAANLKRALKLPRWCACKKTNEAAVQVLKELHWVKTMRTLFEEELKAEKCLKKTHGKGKNIIYFAPEAPRFDESSGGKRLFEIIKLIRELEYNIFFFSPSSALPRYEEALTKLGIEVFFDPLKHEESLLKIKERFSQINCAIFSWWETGDRYIPLIKEIFPEAAIITDSVDVHWLREQRSGLGTPEKKEKEKITYTVSDVVFAVTEEDKNEIIKECGPLNVKLLSNIHREERQAFEGGKNILFVGGFNHPANIEAAMLSYRCFKKFKERTNSAAKLYIVGHNPPASIKALGDDNVIVTGKVDSLTEFYSLARLAIAPITWGAGIKGKICEAAMNRVPIITTDIGNEGINLIHGEECFIGNNERELLEYIYQAYHSNESVLRKMTERAFTKVLDLTSESNAKLVLENCFIQRPVTISILTYNKSKVLAKCIESVVLNTAYPNFQIVVMDNASEDDTQQVFQKLKAAFPQIRLLYQKNQTNNFSIKPTNKILKSFTETDIVLLNDDVEIVSRCWLSHLNNAAYSSAKIACAGGKVLNPNGTLAEAGSALDRTGKGQNIGFGDDPRLLQYNIQRYVGYCSSCVLYLRRDAIHRVGLLDENYDKMYFEESDWQYRAHLEGWKTIYEPRCVSVHLGQMTSKKLAPAFLEANRKKFAEKFKDKDIERYNT